MRQKPSMVSVWRAPGSEGGGFDQEPSVQSCPVSVKRLHPSPLGVSPCLELVPLQKLQRWQVVDAELKLL